MQEVAWVKRNLFLTFSKSVSKKYHCCHTRTVRCWKWELKNTLALDNIHLHWTGFKTIFPYWRSAIGIFQWQCVHFCHHKFFLRVASKYSWLTKHPHPLWRLFQICSLSLWGFIISCHVVISLCLLCPTNMSFTITVKVTLVSHAPSSLQPYEYNILVLPL